MKNKELFDRTVSILVKAYQNDTLMHTNCTACAIGNLICHYNGYYPGRAGTDFLDKSGRNVQAAYWFDPFGFQEYNKSQETEEGLRQLLSTGYNIEEVLLIEHAFELRGKGESATDEDGYLGLMSVIDTLMQIHEATTEEATQAKELFVKVSV